MGILYQDYMSQLHTSSLSTQLFELYTDIQTKLPCTKVLLTKTDEIKQTAHQVSCQSHGTFLRARTPSKDHLEGLSSISLVVP